MEETGLMYANFITQFPMTQCILSMDDECTTCIMNFECLGIHQCKFRMSRQVYPSQMFTI